MSEENARVKRLVHEASGILAAANGKVKIMQAMILVGFTTPECKNMTLYQQVRPRSSNIAVVKVGKENATMVADTVGTNSLASTISSITREDSHDRFVPGCGYNNEGPIWQPHLVVAQASTESAGSKSNDKKPTAKIPRRTSKEVQ
jgi:hypothetical protein